MMTDKTRTARIISRITTWTLRFMVGITILFFISVLVSANLGGNGDVQRQSLEAVFSTLFHKQARIHTLNTYELFPEMRVDFANLVLMDDTSADPTIIIENGLFVQDGLARFTGSRPILALKFGNLITRPGYLGSYSLHLKSGEIVPPETNAKDGAKTSFVMTGDYGGYPISIQVPMLADVSGSKWRYSFVGAEPIKINFAGLDMDLTMTLEKDAVVFDPVRIQTRSGVLNGKMVVPRTMGPESHTVFVLNDAKTGAAIDATVNEFSQNIKIDGAIKGNNINLTDVKNAPITEFFKALADVLRVVKQTNGVGKDLLLPSATIALVTQGDITVIPCHGNALSLPKDTTMTFSINKKIPFKLDPDHDRYATKLATCFH